MRVLLFLDHDRGVLGVSVKPFVLCFRDEAGPLSHIPDLFVRRGDGTGTVVDVRAERSAGQGDFARRAAAMTVACRAAGWSYEVRGTIKPVLEANLDSLAACRHCLVDPLGCAEVVSSPVENDH